MAKVTTTATTAPVATAPVANAPVAVATPMAVAPVGVSTQHANGLVSASRVALGTKAAALVANKAGVALLPHPKGPACKPNTAWGVCYALCKAASAANNGGTFTYAALMAALVNYQWVANGVVTKHSVNASQPVGSALHNAYLGWCATIALQCAATKFSCAVVAKA